MKLSLVFMRRLLVLESAELIQGYSMPLGSHTRFSLRFSLREASFDLQRGSLGRGLRDSGPKHSWDASWQALESRQTHFFDSLRIGPSPTCTWLGYGRNLQVVLGEASTIMLGHLIISKEFKELKQIICKSLSFSTCLLKISLFLFL